MSKTILLFIMIFLINSCGSKSVSDKAKEAGFTHRVLVSSKNMFQIPTTFYVKDFVIENNCIVGDTIKRLELYKYSSSPQYTGNTKFRRICNYDMITEIF